MELFSTREDRIKLGPKNDGAQGVFLGAKGNSKFVSNHDDVNLELKKYGVDGIEYKDGVVDFSPVSEQMVKIDYMTPVKYKNFNQADSKCAELWNFQMKDGKTDWKSRDVANWRKENGYTWHECSDMHHCELVSRTIHENFKHCGGRYECKLRDGLLKAGGGFDE